jgi:hypothetical protein
LFVLKGASLLWAHYQKEKFPEFVVIVSGLFTYACECLMSALAHVAGSCGLSIVFAQIAAPIEE